MKNTKAHIIIGNPDTGKTITAWLVFLMLKEKGSVEYFRSFDDGCYEIKESQDPKNEIHRFTNHYGVVKAWDFCAIIVINNIKIAIYSGGDNEDVINIAFRWIGQFEPDFFVGCCRNHGNSSARKALKGYENEYDMIFHRVYWDYDKADLEHAKESRKALAQKIVNTIMTSVN